MAAGDREEKGLRRVFVSGEDFCGVTDIGCLRRRNEDCLLVSASDGLLVVADGLGGLPAGDRASRSAVDAVAGFLEGRLGRSVAAGEAREILAGAFAAAQREVTGEAARSGNAGMATTLVIGWVCGRRLYCSHVGDVRAYLLRDASAECLTTDHTLAAEMVAAGRLPASLVRNVPERNLLTRAIGLPDEEGPSFTSRELKPNDAVLLCSDGLWEPVLDEELAASHEDILRDPRAAAIELVDLAITRGGRDNISLAVARIR